MFFCPYRICPLGAHVDHQLGRVTGFAIIFSGVERKLAGSAYNTRVDECKSAQHFYEENARVLKGVEAWRQGDLAAFGKLVFESGYSSIHVYETGSEEQITAFITKRYLAQFPERKDSFAICYCKSADGVKLS